MNIQQLFKYAPITLLLITSFVAYAILQLLNGMSLDNPSNRELLTYGANFLPLTLDSEPWRLVSSGFLHIGLMHLLFNSFAMYYFGQVAEQILGRGRFLAVFLLSVVGGNLLNLTVNLIKLSNGNYPSIAAGASGGIMGLGMALLVISISKLAVAKALNRRSLATVMAINLMMGFAIPGIDNAGHIGGAVTGALLAWVFAFFGTSQQKRNFIAVCLCLVAGFCLMWWQLHAQFYALMATPQ